MSTNALQDLAVYLGLDSRELKNVMCRVEHFYREKPIPKASGGTRMLLIPFGALRKVQSKIHRRIFSELKFPGYLHGGVRKRSTRTNARDHVGKQVVMVADVKNYFPSIDPRRVGLVYRRLGFNAEAAKILTRLTTHRFQLPQGAPTSTAIANLVMPRADARLEGLARQQRFKHTRFVDDITISGGKRLAKFGRLVGRVIREEGFDLKKGDSPEVQPNSGPQAVTGLTVNWKLNVLRAKREKMLGEAVDAIKKGKVLSDTTQGRIAYVRHLNPKVGTRISKEAKRLRKNEKSSSRH